VFKKAGKLLDAELLLAEKAREEQKFVQGGIRL